MRVITSMLVGGVVVMGMSASGGPLSPPAGIITETYKTLEDVEPRVMLRRNPDGVTNITINKRGSYYLAEDLSGFIGQPAIQVNADNVTIDMNGFTITGSTELVLDEGIAIASNVESVAIRNGTIRDCGSGISGSGASSVIVEDVRVENTLASTGIFLGENSRVSGCVVVGAAGVGVAVGSSSIIERTIVSDTGSTGIQAVGGGIIRQCSVRNTSGTGISGGFQGVIEDCEVSDTGDRGISASSSIVRNCHVSTTESFGILVGGNASVIGCTVINASTNGGPWNGIDGSTGVLVENCVVQGVQGTGNGIDLDSNGMVRGCVVKDINNNGIDAGNDSTVEECRVNNATNDGIKVHSGSRVMGNEVYSNTVGIHVSFQGCVVDGNFIRGNGTGVLVDSTANFIVRNIFTLNTTRDTIVGGNDVGTWSANSAGAGAWDNIH